MPEQSLLLQNLKSSDGGREMLMAVVVVLLMMMMIILIVNATYKYKHKAATDSLLVTPSQNQEATSIPKPAPFKYSPSELNTPSFKIQRCIAPSPTRPSTLPVPR